MSERDIKTEEDAKDIQDDIGDDEVRDGPSHTPNVCLECPTTRRDFETSSSGRRVIMKKIAADDVKLGRNICYEEKGR